MCLHAKQTWVPVWIVSSGKLNKNSTRNQILFCLRDSLFEYYTNRHWRAKQCSSKVTHFIEHTLNINHTSLPRYCPMMMLNSLISPDRVFSLLNNKCILKAVEDRRTFLPIEIMQHGHYHHMQLATMHNWEISIHAPLLLAIPNSVIIMSDFEPFNYVIMTHYFCVFFDLQFL